MNPVAVRLTHAVMIVAALAAIVIAAPVKSQPEVVVLPQVTVTGHRATLAATPDVVMLPKVMVTGRRAADDGQPVFADRRDAPKPLLVALR